jgi:trk system potassium uptake protein TrkH
MQLLRWLLVLRQGTREVTRLIRPSAEVAVKLNDKPVGPRLVEAVWGFFAVYLVVLTLLMPALIGTGVEQVTPFSAIATCINNVGPGLGEVASSFTAVNPAGLWISPLAMLRGRLEIFRLLILFTITFWRK